MLLSNDSKLVVWTPRNATFTLNRTALLSLSISLSQRLPHGPGIEQGAERRRAAEHVHEALRELGIGRDRPVEPGLWLGILQAGRHQRVLDHRRRPFAKRLLIAGQRRIQIAAQPAIDRVTQQFGTEEGVA